jgi:hypothetical protein
VRNGILVEPGNSDALAEALLHLHRDPDLCHALSSAGRVDVEQYEMNRITRIFLLEVAKGAPAIRMSDGTPVRSTSLLPSTVQQTRPA